MGAPWDGYEGLSAPGCVVCCALGCAIECVSQTFSGSPACAAVAVVEDCDPSFIDVTCAVTGNTVTTTGTLTNGGTSATVLAGLEQKPADATAGRYACGFVASSGTGVIDITGTNNDFRWGVNLAYAGVKANVWADTAVNLDAYGDVEGTVPCIKTVDAPIIASPAATTGEECISYFDRDAYTDTGPCGSVTPILFLTDGTFDSVFVRARLRLFGLSVGLAYTATIGIGRRLRGSVDDWEIVETLEYNFDATMETEYTDYVDVGGTASEYEFSAVTCTIERAFAPPYTCDDYYDFGYAQGLGCRPCDFEGTGGCTGGDPESPEQCWLDGYNQGYIDGGC